VKPDEKPRICVCTAPETPTVQRSELIDVIAGAIADGGGDFTVVSLIEFDVLLDVESVTIGSACALAHVKNITKSTIIGNFLNISYSFLYSLT
jgi:hypothetical protein